MNVTIQERTVHAVHEWQGVKYDGHTFLHFKTRSLLISLSTNQLTGRLTLYKKWGYAKGKERK